MALYLGNNKVKFMLGGQSFRLVVQSPPMVDGIMLIASDGYRLKDVDNVYLTTYTPLLSLDDYMLKDSIGLYLIAKEDK